jgi:hypothetical protein
VWDLVASGLLPALADLHLEGSGGLSWGSEGECRLARALEAVAGTLRRLTLRTGAYPKRPPVAACRELGFALGKMRRLTYLSLFLFEGGRSYHLVGRGVAASGGCPPLERLHLDGVRENLESLTYEPSLIVPSVRRLSVRGRATEEEALLMCCGLVRMGYKHRLADFFKNGFFFIGGSPAAKACMAAVLQSGGITVV